MQILCQVPTIASKRNVFPYQKAHPEALRLYIPTLASESQTIALETTD
jgi:hypothetical protein